MAIALLLLASPGASAESLERAASGLVGGLARELDRTAGGLIPGCIEDITACEPCEEQPEPCEPPCDFGMMSTHPEAWSACYGWMTSKVCPPVIFCDSHPRPDSAPDPLETGVPGPDP